MVNAGIWCGVCDSFKGRTGTIGVSGRRHFPREVDLGLVYARLLTTLLHHRVFGIVRVTGGDAH